MSFDNKDYNKEPVYWQDTEEGQRWADWAYSEYLRENGLVSEPHEPDLVTNIVAKVKAELEVAERYDNLDDNYKKPDSQEKKESPYGPYVSKDDLRLPWIRCLWCPYRDKIEFDLSLHMLEKHRDQLLQLTIYSAHRKRTKALSGDFSAKFEGAIEFRLDVAVEMAKEQNRGKGVRNAVRILQRRAVERRKARQQQRIEVHVIMRDPELKAPWEKQRQEWLDRWPPEVNPVNRYVPCKECHKLIVKNQNQTGICDNCYWLDIYWNKGGVRVDPQNWGV